MAEPACGTADASAPQAGPHRPERTCILTRRHGGPEDLLRFVLGPGEIIVPDLKRKLPGRGVWVDATAQTLGEAVQRGAFAKAFRKKVIVPDDLVGQVDGLLAQDALQALSLARKAGALVLGATKIEESARKVVALLHAREAAEDSVGRLAQVVFRAREGTSVPIVSGEFTIEQLSLSLGRELVVHAALIAHAASSYAMGRLSALQRFRGRRETGAAAKALPRVMNE